MANPSYVPDRWLDRFDERQQKHILFCAGYARNFAHGAPGHLDMVVISLLLDCLHDAAQELSGHRLTSADDATTEPGQA